MGLSEYLIAAFDKAEKKLNSAKILLDHREWEDAASRAYYAAFHAISAVLRSKDLSFSSHSRTIGAFNKHFISTGIFPVEWGSRLTKMMKDREAGDYRTSSEIGEQIAREDVQFADEIVRACKGYLKIL